MTIYNQTKIHLSVFDRVKVLLGKKIHLRTQIDVTTETQVKDTRQTIYVDRLFPKKERVYTEVTTLEGQKGANEPLPEEYLNRPKRGRKPKS